MDGKQAFELEEYKHVVAEIAFLDKTGLQLFAASVVASLAVWSLVGSLVIALSPGVILRYLYLVPAFLNLVSFSLITDGRVSIRRAGTYLEVFFDRADRGSKWEARLVQFRKLKPGETWDVIPFTYWVLFAVSAALFFFVYWREMGWPYYDPVLLIDGILLGSLSVALAFGTRRFAAAGSGGPIKNEMRARWETIKQSEESNRRANVLQQPAAANNAADGV